MVLWPGRYEYYENTKQDETFEDRVDSHLSKQVRPSPGWLAQ